MRVAATKKFSRALHNYLAPSSSQSRLLTTTSSSSPTIARRTLTTPRQSQPLIQSLLASPWSATQLRGAKYRGSDVYFPSLSPSSSHFSFTISKPQYFQLPWFCSFSQIATGETGKRHWKKRFGLPISLALQILLVLYGQQTTNIYSYVYSLLRLIMWLLSGTCHHTSGKIYQVIWFTIFKIIFLLVD